MSSKNATIQQVIPVFIKAIVFDDLVTVNKLLNAYPKLVHLKDGRDRNILMMAVYGLPHNFKAAFAANSANFAAVPAANVINTHNVLNYLISFYVITDPVIDINAVDADGLNVYDWAVLAGNDFAISLINKLKENDESQ